MNLQEIFAIVGALGLTSAMAVGFAFALFRFFGEKWISSKFDKEIINFKHEQNKEIEKLKFRINNLFDRATKLNSREFEVIPEAWSLAWEAYRSTTRFLSKIKSYPALDGINEEILESFLEDTPLKEFQKSEIRSATRKTEKYIEQIYFHERNDNKDNIYKYRDYLKKNGIFIPREIKMKFLELEDILYEASRQHELNHEENIKPRLKDKIDFFHKEGEKILDDLEEIVEKSVWDFAKVE